MHHCGVPCDPDTRDQVDSDKEAELMSELKEFVALTFPNLHPEPAIKERCMYTVSIKERYMYTFSSIHNEKFMYTFSSIHKGRFLYTVSIQGATCIL